MIMEGTMQRILSLVAVAIMIALHALHAQVPFTAREGLSPAQQEVAVTTPPSAVGTNNLPLELQGKSPLWFYAFSTDSGVIAAMVLQPVAGTYSATLVPAGDTANLPIYVNAEPLPADFIDSDSAMRIFAQNSVYQEWMQTHRAESPLLIAGRLLQPIPFPQNTPVWVFRTTDSSGTYVLTCWCAVDGTMSSCESGYSEGTYRYPVHEALPLAQQAAQTQQQPCLVGAENADTNGLATAWIYAFPSGDSAVAVYTTSVGQGIFQAAPIPLDTTDAQGMPLYFRAESFSSGWINSDVALARMRATDVFRQWTALYQYDTTNTVLLGGRARPEVAPIVGTSEGTAVWLFIARAVGNPNEAELVCWCNLEPQSPGFEGCASAQLSIPSSSSDLAIVLAPNPAQEGVAIRTGADIPIERITVHSVDGRMLNMPLMVAGAIAWVDTSALPVGTYIVTVRAGGKQQRQLLHVMR